MRLQIPLLPSLIVLAVAAGHSAGQSRPATIADSRSREADAIGSRSSQSAGASTSPDSNSPPSLPLQFVKDYFPGTVDIAGRPLAGTEMMNFAVHAGRLNAGLGNRNLPDDATVRMGAQVIVKDSADAAWRVEHQFAPTDTSTIASIPFPPVRISNGTRAMIVSPFDNTTVFAGGGDIGKQISLNTAWIYKGTLSEYEK